MKTREAVTIFFSETLQHRPLPGQFFFTKGRIRAGGLFPGERLLFTYESKCVYEARSTTGRIANESANRDRYPFHFCVDVKSIAALSGSLEAFEQKLIQLGLYNGKKIAGTHPWSRIDETEAFQSRIDSLLDEIRQEH